MIEPFQKTSPRIAEEVYVSPTAVVIGDVELGYGSSVWCCAVIRGDVWRISVGELQLVCVGDAFHGEARAAARWFGALEEYMGGYREHTLMDAEMRESLGVMEMAMRVKCAFPAAFHFLKGNHENVANEQGRGNHPFIKFAAEGEMVAAYVMRFLGVDFMRGVYRYEHNLPLLAVGRDFLVSHGEPRRPFARREVVEYRRLDEVVEGLTWTDNGAAEPGSVRTMRQAASALALRKPEDILPARSDLISLLDNPDVRMVAMRALASLGPQASPAVSRLREFLADKDSYVRGAAVYTLSRIGPEATEILKSCIGDPDPTIAGIVRDAMKTK